MTVLHVDWLIGWVLYLDSSYNLDFSIHKTETNYACLSKAIIPKIKFVFTDVEYLEIFTLIYLNLSSLINNKS